MKEKIKNNKVLLIILLIVFATTISTFGRFVYNEIKKNFFLTQNFYFNSDKLKETQANYIVNNYNGVDNYDIIINVNSIKNNLLKTTQDISYNISFSCSSNANCSSSKPNGVIYEATGKDFFVMTLSPNVALVNGDSLEIVITASSTDPYEKTISAKFKLIVGNYGLSYEIKDEPNSPYLELKVTNTLDYYKVLQAFGSYAVGTQLDLDTYLALSQANKDKCASAIINLSFNPTIILFDNVNDISDDIISSTTIPILGNNYINALSFKLDAISSIIVRFYKKNAVNNYTYPIVNPTSIVTVTYTL